MDAPSLLVLWATTKKKPNFDKKRDKQAHKK